MDLENKRAFGYVRVSTSNQDLERQKKQISDFCENRNIALIRIYSEKISGATDVLDREQLSLLLKKDYHDADLVIISEMSRYSRDNNLIKVVFSITEILDKGLALLFLDDETKVYEAGTILTMEDTIILVAKAFANAQERQKIVDRMFGRKLQLIELFPNVVLGKAIPFGYKKVDNPEYKPNIHNGQPKAFLEIDDDEAKIVKDMFQMCADGKTLKVIQKYWNDHNTRTFENNKKRKEKYGNDEERRSIYVSNILNNTIYYGLRNFSFVDKDKTINKKWPFDKAIISKELFDKAKKVREEHLKMFDKTRLHVNPLKGLIKCVCGNSMVITNIKGRIVYTCYRSKLASKDADKKWCGNYGIGQELLMNIIIYDVENGLDDSHKIKYDLTSKLRLEEIRNELSNKQKQFDEVNKNIKENRKISSNYANLIGHISDTNKQLEFYNLKVLIDKDIDKANLYLNTLDDEIRTLRDLERSIIDDKRNAPFIDPNTDDFADYLKTIITEIIYQGYDVMNGLVSIKYKNGYVAYYKVKKARTNRITKQRYTALFWPIASDNIHYDANNRVVIPNDDNELVQITDYKVIPDLIKNGHVVVIEEDKHKKFKPRYIINDNNSH